MLPQEVAASKAHASALIAAGILTADEGRKSATALDAIAADHASEAARSSSAITPPPKTFTTSSNSTLVERVGSLGLKLHTGRSRNEQIATDLRLYVRERISLTLDASSHG